MKLTGHGVDMMRNVINARLQSSVVIWSGYPKFRFKAELFASDNQVIIG